MFKGFSQTAEAPLKVLDESFQPHTEVGVDGVGTVYVGQDLRLYRKTTGLVRVIAPCSPLEETEPEAWLEGVQWEDFPPMGELRYLYETFLRQYDREVMFVIGKKWDETGWFYMVPDQEGTVAGIDWEDKEGMEEMFSPQARWVGTCHVHPGTWCDPSGTDIGNWEKPEQSGLHVIFGRNGDFSVTGSAAGFSMGLLKGQIEGWEPIEIVLETSMGRSLEALLRRPPPPPVQSYRFAKRTQETENWFEDLWNKRERKETPVFVTKGDDPDSFGALFSQVGALECEEKDVKKLRMVRHRGMVYLMTSEQFRTAQTWHSEKLPASTVLKVGRKGT